MITMFLGRKIKTDSKFKFSFFLFDQMSFRSSDVSIKCRLIKCRSINCQVMKKYTDKNENNSKTLQFTNCCKLQHTDTI